MDKLEIKGKVNTALCYAKVVEDEAIDQIQRMCDYEFTKGSRIRIMPDVHAGKGCTIGTTMTIVDKAVPNIVGVDIGCGMLTINIGKTDMDFEKLDEAAHYIPSGKDVWEGRKAHFDLEALRCYRQLKDSRRLERSLGTLGGGNHFIEVDEAPMAYKRLEDIIDVIKESVDIIDVMKPIYNFKASEQEEHLPPKPEQEEDEMFTIPAIDMAKTGQNIVVLRKQAGLSVKDLQDAFGFATPQAIYKWQQGLALPTIDNLVVLAALLGVSIDDIIVTDMQNQI